ncbi:MAG TPA: Rossmann fold nucleotide-binding protein [Ornithinibacter sp.]|nr:Rossmann fold nucleotide-binding protein [Ornithinibacter sp.]
MHEIEDLPSLAAVLRSARPLTGVRLQDLDLTGHEDELLARTDVEGLVVLGGRVGHELARHLRLHGALVFPADPHVPVNPYRATLYQPSELYAGLREHGYEATPDALAYHWSRDGALHHDAFVTLLRAIHDDSMSDALAEVIGRSPVVGVMGGHALLRGSAEYAGAARLGHALAQAGLVVATGGGPGAMEAANLGAFAASTGAVDDALARLAGIPSFVPEIEPWAQVALDVHDDLVAARGGVVAVRSLGIPTWFYGHEPPNVFCDGIAKYFSNAIREDGLLARCDAGIVVLPGAAGTVQEVFQAATRLFYATPDAVLPRLVLVGREHWTRTIPVWPALQALAAGRPMARHLYLVDSPADAVALLTR